MYSEIITYKTEDREKFIKTFAKMLESECNKNPNFLRMMTLIKDSDKITIISEWKTKKANKDFIKKNHDKIMKKAKVPVKIYSSNSFVTY